MMVKHFIPIMMISPRLRQPTVSYLLFVIFGWSLQAGAFVPEQQLLTSYETKLGQQSVLVYSQPDLEFGGLVGNFVALLTREGYRFVFLTQYAQDPLVTEIPIRMPRDTDAFFDIVVHKVISAGPKESKDLVVEQSYSRPQIAGGSQQKIAELYRLEAGSARHLQAYDEILSGELTEAKEKRLQNLLKAEVSDNPARVLKAGLMKIPQGYIYYSGRERLDLLNNQKGRVLVDDPKNGYLQIAGDAGLPGIVLVMFTRNHSSPLYVLQIQDTVRNHTFFLEQTGSGWRDVSGEVMPDYDKADNYQLPRYGTTIVVDTSKGPIDLVWNKNNFVLKN